ncbi:helix-turn-helix domain-containing protein [Streptomyces halobius]|uniref:Helix-turn-helix domain-containing protein n=1 Tax=Streptomyces halobius TaxID=2879846 RepID=A0ABY4MF51_9ACTN|nr:helix-turn-helix domain-containing protein [Streptomyces halobius]UQA94961.1 helix-turn-helix domain-containing protein [Streptomyces halobius]
MRVHRTSHPRDFVIVPNSAARHRGLSFTARGILIHLLSLPDGAKEDVRTLADRNPGVGRRGVSKAVQELEDAGYYFRRTIRDPETGRVWTETFVYDTPQESPVPASPGTGDPAARSAGTLPTGVKELSSKTPEKPLPSPSVAKVQTPAAPAREGFQGNGHQGQEAARVLARLATMDVRLRLSQRQVQGLVPLAAQWLQNGASAVEIADALVHDLPAKVHSAAKLVADRLTRKLPEPRRSWARYVDCGQCRNPLPVGQPSGICAVCSGVQVHPDLQALAADSEPDPAVVVRASEIRAAMRAHRSAVAA